MTLSRKQVRETPQYGSIYAHGVSSQITSNAQNDWDQVLSFANNGAYGGGVVPDYTNSHIIIGISGQYQIHFEWSGYGPAVKHNWLFQIKKNNGATSFNSITAHVTTPTTQDQDSNGCSDIVSLSSGDTIELWVQRESAGTNVLLTSVHSTLSIHKVGP